MTSVALVASSFLPRTGGVEEHVRHLALGLRDRGHRIAVWAVDQGDPPATLPGITVRYLPTPLPASSPRSVRDFTRAAPYALRAWQHAFRSDRPEVVHVQCFGPNGPWASAMAALHRAPLVIGAHGETFMDEHRVFERSRLQQAALRMALRRAAAVTTCSQYAADDLARFGYDPARASVVRNGVDPAEPAGAVPAGLPSRYLLGLGRHVRVKGFDLLLRAFARAIGAGGLAGLSLVIAGDGPERQRLAALAAELGVADRIVLPGRLDHGQVTAVMAGAEALVVPSRVEAFGIVVLEGLRAGVPVIATSLGGVAEFAADAAVLVDPTDLGALATALTRVATDDGLRHRLAELGPNVAAAHTWERVTDRVEAVYRTLGRASPK